MLLQFAMPGAAGLVLVVAGIQVFRRGVDGSGEFFEGRSMKSLFAVLILAAAGLHSDPALAQKSD